VNRRSLQRKMKRSILTKVVLCSSDCICGTRGLIGCGCGCDQKRCAAKCAFQHCMLLERSAARGLRYGCGQKEARQNEPSSSACFWDGLQLGAFVMVAVKKESRQDVPSSSICFRNGLQLEACQIVLVKWTELCAWRIAGKDR